MRMLCGTAEIVMFTGTITFCAGFTLDTGTTPEYTAGERPVGSAVMFTLVEAKAPSDTFAVDVLSHPPPAVVVVIRFTLSDPPPAFDTERVLVREEDCCTNEKFKNAGFTLRLG